MSFKKYSSIVNANNQRVIEKILTSPIANDRWYVTEKIHGANVSILIEVNENDELDIKLAKRSGVIGNTQNFFTIHLREFELKLMGTMVYKIMKNMDISSEMELKSINIFGEWFGGYYPHKEVKQMHDRKTVQKGIAYSPDVHFAPFDILVNDEIYLSFEEKQTIFKSLKILEPEIIILDVLKTGTFKECYEYDINFNSMIPKKIGLPELEDNIVEGIVIKYCGRRIRGKKSSPNHFKKKNKKFTEMYKHKHLRTSGKEISEDQIKFVKFIVQCATENRVDNVISKYGDVSHKDIGTLIKLTNEDIIKEAHNEIPEVVEKLNKKDIRNLMKRINKNIAMIVKAKIEEV